MPGEAKAPVSWRVVSQVETVAPDALGRVVPGVQVTFETATGLTGSVFVPRAQYSVENVRKLIVERVTLLHQVQNLSE